MYEWKSRMYEYFAPAGPPAEQEIVCMESYAKINIYTYIPYARGYHLGPNGSPRGSKSTPGGPTHGKL